MIAKRIFLALTFAAIVAVSVTVAQTQSTDTEPSATQPASQGGILDVIERIKQAQAQRLEGAWRVQVTIRNCQTGAALMTNQSLNTFSRGGSMVGTPAIPGVTLLGVWQHTGGRSFTNTIVGFRFNPDGTYAGTGKTTRTIEIGDDFDEFTSNDSTESFDVNDNLIAKGCATTKGRRLK
ncbi:MAG: hypothetical protein ACREEM_23130 [Blastocatellia bacterium]